MVCNAHRYVAIVGVHHCDKNGPGFGKAQFSGADCQWWFHHAGMPEVHVAASALYDPKLKGRVALISDTRVSGVSSGAVGVHCAPEAALGGPISKLIDGDLIRFDLRQGFIHADVHFEERQPLQNPTIHPRGYRADFARLVSQANEGCESFQ